MNAKRTSRPTRQLEPNSPEKRIEHVLKLYWQKYPNACIDTATVAAFLFGIDHAAPSALLRSQYAWRQFHQSEHEQEALLVNLDEGSWQHEAGSRELIARLNLLSAYPPATRQDWALVSLVIFIVRSFPKRHEYESIVPWIARELVAVTKSKPVRWEERHARTQPYWVGFLDGDERDDDRDGSISLRYTRFADGGGSWTAFRGQAQICPTTDQVDDLKQLVQEHILRDLIEELVELLIRKITAIAQWAKETRTDILKVTVAQALDAIATYQFKAALVPQGTVLFSFPDGWTVQELTTQEQLGGEGKTMQHCVGSYADAVERGISRIYSLRDPSGNPHVTMEWAPDTGNVNGRGFGKYAEPGDPEWDEYVALSPQQFMKSRFRKMGRFEQIYGKQNEKPAEKYVPRVREFIEKMFDGNVKALMLLGIPLTEMDLRNKELSGLDFAERAQDDDPTAYAHELRVRGLDFTGSNMTGCVFDENIVENCTFDNCDLRDASFSKAALHDTTFVDADLRGANFSLARFTGAHTSLRGANVEKASFHTDRYGGTGIIEKLLSQTRGNPYYTTTYKRGAGAEPQREFHVDEELADPNDEDDAYP